LTFSPDYRNASNDTVIFDVGSTGAKQKPALVHDGRITVGDVRRAGERSVENLPAALRESLSHGPQAVIAALDQKTPAEFG
jgi:hypothetical protein